MPLLQLQLQRSVGSRLCSQAFIRSHSRSFCARVPTYHKRLVCQAARDSQDSDRRSSFRRGFGSSSGSQQKQQKAQVNNTTDALLRSLGGSIYAHMCTLHASGVMHHCNHDVVRDCRGTRSNMTVMLQKCQAALAETLGLETWCLVIASLKKSGGS